MAENNARALFTKIFTPHRSLLFEMQGSREFVLRLEGILPTGLCLSFGFLFFGIFSYAAFFGPPVAQQATSCAGAAAKRSSSLLLSRLGLELASHD